MKLNKAAFEHAKSLIQDNKVVQNSDWSKRQPSASDENQFLDKHNWDAFAKWHLGIDEDENEETKGHYGFPYGDFKSLHRDGVIAAKQRAAQNDYDDIEDAADKLLQMIDK